MRLNQLEGSGIVEALENVIQATQLLQVNKKTLEDVDAICEVCSSLNTLQVKKAAKSRLSLGAYIFAFRGNDFSLTYANN